MRFTPLGNLARPFAKLFLAFEGFLNGKRSNSTGYCRPKGLSRDMD